MFFLETKTHTSPWEFEFPSFLVETGDGRMPFQVGWKQGGPCGQRSKLQTGGEPRKSSTDCKGGRAETNVTNHLCKETYQSHEILWIYKYT